MDILKVSSKSSPNSIAGALAGVVREKGSAELQAVGAGAINQAIKATAIARGFMVQSGMDIVCSPSFTEVTIDGAEKTAQYLEHCIEVADGDPGVFNTEFQRGLKEAMPVQKLNFRK